MIFCHRSIRLTYRKDFYWYAFSINYKITQDTFFCISFAPVFFQLVAGAVY